MKEVVTVLNMRESDQFTIRNKVDSKTLMYRASLGVYDSVSWYGKIAIFCGSGNNAGDGYALALILKEASYDVEIILCSEKFSFDGKHYFDLAISNQIKAIKFEDIAAEYDIIVDCLLGTGFVGEVKGKIKDAINYINNSNAYIVSVDINSGLNGDNGTTSLAVISDLTVSIGSYKTGHFLNDAKDYIKKVINKDIGISLLEKPFYLVEKNDVKKFIKPRKENSNKGTYGYVGIMGGSANYPGAPRLANLGQTALYSGCGVSKIIVPDSIYELMFNNVLETVIAKIPSSDGKMVFDKMAIDTALKGLKAIGIGVGWGESSEYIKIIEYILNNYEMPVVIDADGLNTLAKIDLDILNKTNCKVILTPHLKEFSRLIKKEVIDVVNNPIKLVQEFVGQYHVTLLLKGPSTIIANKETLYLVSEGTNGMATAGSGDVLTGILVGLLGRYNENITLTTAMAAYLNGYSGMKAKEMYGDIGMVASDTARMVSLVMKELTEEK